MSAPAWRLPTAADRYDLDSRVALRAAADRGRQLLAARSFVAETPDGFARVIAGVTRVDPSHPLAASHPDAWRLGPARGRDVGRDEERSGGTFALAPSPPGQQPGRTMVGHFAVFDRFTEINSAYEGHFLERVAPGAFAGTIRAGGQRVLLQHGRDPQLGLKPIGAVESLAEDAVGAAYRVRLLDGVPEVVVAGLAAGQYGASFQFRSRREDLVQRPGASAHNPTGLPERTLLELSVREFGPCTWGAYSDASASIEGAAA